MTDGEVFINCPFSDDYAEHFRAIVFAVLRSGFTPRCARENDDGGEVRIDKICRIIGECRYGIHDISKTEPDPVSRLPRFNMPLELGLFLGARKYGGSAQARMKALILDTEPYRYQQFMSDIAGQDVNAHGGDVHRLIEKVANWLRDEAGDPEVPGGRIIASEFDRFSIELPIIAAKRRLDVGELTFRDLATFIAAWIVSDVPAT